MSIRDHIERHKGKYGIALGALLGAGMVNPERSKQIISQAREKVGKGLISTGQKLQSVDLAAKK